MNRPRVLQLCAVDFTARHFLKPLVRFLEGKGCEVVMACTPGPHWQEMQAEGLRLHPIDIRRNYNVLAHRRAVNDLTEYLTSEHFDIIHTHTPIAALIGRIAATRAGVPVRFYTAHGFYFHDRMNPILRRAHIELERFGARYCDFIFTQSEEDRLTAIRAGIVAESKIKTIGNGIDLRRFSREAVTAEDRDRLKAELGIRNDDRIVAIIGRLVPEKGYGELFEAVRGLRREIPNLRLLVIGQALPSDRTALGGDRLREEGAFIFAGMRSDVPALLSLAEIFTLPSWREGMPRSVIEAMGMGLPVVATDIRGCREEVVHEQTGLLVPVKNAKELAAALKTLLLDTAKAKTFGAAGRARAEERYDERAVLERQWDVYRRVLP